MKAVDQIFGWLMILGALAHGMGSWQAYRNDHMTFLWALSASFAVILLASVNLLRALRRPDRTLGWICFSGCLVWIGFVLVFGSLIGNLFDFRVLIHLVITASLAAFSLRTIFALPRP